MSELSHPLLTRYWPSERRAILVHKYFMGLERSCDPAIEEVLESWEENFAHAWRCEKMKRDAQAQLAEIDAHRSEMAAEAGRSITFEEAARDWVYHHEHKWRTRWESTSLAGA